MPLDASILRGLQQPKSPFQQAAELAQVQGAQNQSRLAELQFQQAESAAQEGNVLSRLYRDAMGADGNFDRNKLLTGAAQSGLGKKIPEFQKTFAEQDKAKYEAEGKAYELASKRYDGFKKAMNGVYNDPNASRESVLGVLAEQVDAGLMPLEKAQAIASKVPTDPAALKQYIAQGLRAQLAPKDVIEMFAAKPTQIDNGQQISFRDTNPNSPTYGQNTGGAPVQRMQTPDSVASQQTQIRGQNLTDARARENITLRKKELDAAGMQPSGLPILGVPAPAVLPWQNQTNPRDANKVKAAEQTRGAKEIEKDIDAAKKERDAAAAAKRFIELNDKVATGGLVDRMGVTRGLQSLGSDYAEMEAITAKLAPAMRQEGSGSTSDFDGKQFERATVGVDKPKAANKNIAQAVIARAQNAEEYADFRQTYFEQNGTLQGADRYWKEYANKNPIFDPSKPGTFELNNKRKPWSEHFKSANPAKPAGATGSGLSPAEAAEMEELRKRLGK